MSIHACHVRKSFGARQVVDDVSFDIATGTIVGLIGPNGSGKTTILRMLSTFLAPSAGQIVIDGHDSAVDPIAARLAIGYLPEALPGYSDARVVEFLEFRARLKEISRRERRAEIDRCLKLCDLVAVKQRLLGRLSQGFRRRAGLADALLGSPPVLLLDEPTVGLDPLQVRQTRELLKELSPGTAVLLSSHHLAEVKSTCDRVLMLFNGRLVSTDSVANEAVGPTFEITLRAPAIESAALLRTLPGVRDVRPVATRGDTTTWSLTVDALQVRERVVRECAVYGWGVCELRVQSDDLESRFVRAALNSGREAA
jgi:ABC-2 type transport system ATP-binding protein